MLCSSQAICHPLGRKCGGHQPKPAQIAGFIQETFHNIDTLIALWFHDGVCLQVYAVNCYVMFNP
jgi:hypothetical protein